MHAHHELHDGGAMAVAMGVLVGLCLLALGAYLVGLWRLRGAGRGWNPWRTAAFLSGLGLVVVGLVPPLADAAHRDLRLHMVQHLLSGMVGPVGIALGAPVGLALRALPTVSARRLVALLRLPVVRGLIHPVTALLLNLGGMAVLYTTPLFLAMGSSAALHFAVHFHFLAAGCLFSWSIAGTDPVPERPSHRVRLAALFFAIAGHATLAKAMYAFGWPAGTGASLREIEQAAQLMYYGGDFSEILLAIALFATWPWAQRIAAAPPVAGPRGTQKATPAPSSKKSGPTSILS